MIVERGHYMTATPLTDLRTHLAHGWLVILFGVIYVISQTIIISLLEQIGGPLILTLQVTWFTAADYVATFSEWDAAGLMEIYRAHLVFDDFHAIWYAVLMAATLATLMKNTGAGDGWTKLLVIPFAAGFCDMVENGIQHIFLTGTSYSTIVDPLPAITTIMSITKWSLSLAALSLIAILLVRYVTGQRAG